MNTNIDTVAFFQGFQNLKNDGKITDEQYSLIIKDFRSKPSYGPGSLRRTEISFDDAMDVMTTLPKYFKTIHEFVYISRYVDKYLYEAILINTK